MENSGGFQAAFDTLAKLQEVQFSALRSDMAEVKADVKLVIARQDLMESRQDQLEEAVRLFTELFDYVKSRVNKKGFALLGSALGGVIVVANFLSRYAPVEATEPIDEVRHRLSQDYRANEDSERDSAIPPEPCRHQLEGWGIHAREKKAGREAQRDSDAAHASELHESVRCGSTKRSAQDHVFRWNDVGKIQETRDQRAAHKAQLNGDRQPCGGSS